MSYLTGSSVPPPSVAAPCSTGRATNPLVSIHCRARGASCRMGGWVPWHDSEAAASMGLVALAAGRPGSPTAAVETEAAARAFASRAEAADAAIENFHAAVVARLTSLYGTNGLCARSKTREQEMRVLQLLHMDNQMNMFHQAMQGSSPAVRDVWDLSSHQHAVLVQPGPTSVASTLPIASGAKRRAVSMPADKASKRCRWMGQPQLLNNERRPGLKLDSPATHHRRRNAISHEGAWRPILDALPCYRQGYACTP